MRGPGGSFGARTPNTREFIARTSKSEGFMSSVPALSPRRIILSAVAIIALLIAAPGIAPADPVNPPIVDPTITPPAGNVAFLVAHAVGTQTYTCNGDGTWSATSVPQADLFDDHGHLIGQHFAGPTWQFKDGSSVKGQKIAGVASPSGSIAWLLLKEVSTSAGPDGNRFTIVTYVQRLNTTGGVPTSCTGTTVSVPYTADYYFYRSFE